MEMGEKFPICIHSAKRLSDSTKSFWVISILHSYFHIPEHKACLVKQLKVKKKIHIQIKSLYIFNWFMVYINLTRKLNLKASGYAAKITVQKRR